ncbi:MAG: hypothetical protein ABEJ34_06800 [Haloferacaceae archaeon]
MNSRGLNTAMELYRSGTLTLTQAAQRAGCTEDQLLRALHSSGLCVGPVDGGTVAAD